MRPLRCLVGLHAWSTGRTEDGQVFRTCTRCRVDEGDLPDDVRVPLSQRDARSQFFDRGGGGFGSTS
ncbi:hypothetical protein [Kineococcus terrestris]|uniref:hypothetical protein n=1 Tax=Kineococcus terrestris TaxID=2044856 RepID=UPI0034DB1E85